MSLSVLDLKPGDRVVLNCPRARREAKRDAIFEGVFDSIDRARDRDTQIAIEIGGAASRELLAPAPGKRWARFLFESRPTDMGLMMELAALFVVDPDGGMHEDEGRRVFVERRVVMGYG